ncbi:Ubiquitin-conjugating enzyme E2 4 [Ordospora colligata]
MDIFENVVTPSSSMATISGKNRLLIEMESMAKNPPPGCSAGPVNPDELDKWNAVIMGPPGSIYEDGMFELQIVFPPFYPFSPPKVTFNTRIFHCNIFEKNVCLDILKDQWTPALTIDKVLLSIIVLLQEPNPDDPLNGEAAGLYRKNIEKYEKKAKKWVKLYASKYKSEDEVL